MQSRRELFARLAVLCGAAAVVPIAAKAARSDCYAYARAVLTAKFEPVPVVRGVNGKADIWQVGSVSQVNGIAHLNGWAFSGGSYPGLTVSMNVCCGYTISDLTEISRKHSARTIRDF